MISDPDTVGHGRRSEGAMRLAIGLALAAGLAVPASAERAADPRCAQYGPGFVYSEGTGFCIKLSGSVETGLRFGKGPFNDHEGGGGASGKGFESEVDGRIDARKDTELGPLRLYVQPKWRVPSSDN
jgi:hypothetical protein